MGSKAEFKVLVFEKAESASKRLVSVVSLLSCDSEGRAFLVEDEMNGAIIACMEYGADGSGHGNGRVISFNMHSIIAPRLLF